MMCVGERDSGQEDLAKDDFLRVSSVSLTYPPLAYGGWHDLPVVVVALGSTGMHFPKSVTVVGFLEERVGTCGNAIYVGAYLKSPPRQGYGLSYDTQTTACVKLEK